MKDIFYLSAIFRKIYSDIYDGKLLITRITYLLFFISFVCTIGCSKNYKKIVFSKLGFIESKAVKNGHSREETRRLKALSFFDKGISFVNKGEFENAVKEFKGALQIDPYMEKAILDLGITYLHLGKNSKSIDIFIDLLSSGTNEIQEESLYNLGLAYTFMEDYENALVTFNFFKNSPDFKDTLLNIGLIYLLMGKSGLAKEALTLFLDRYPNDVVGNYYLALLYLKDGGNAYEAAREKLIKVVAKSPDLLKANEYLGITDFYLGRYKEAIESLTKFTGKNPDSAQAFYYLGKSYQGLGDNTNAMNAYMIAARFNHTDSLIEMSKIFMENNNISLAKKKINAFIDIYPENSPSYFALGLLSEKEMDLEGAIKAYKKAAEIDDTNFQAQNNLGLLYRQRGEFDLAVKEFNNILKKRPGFTAAHKNLGIIYELYLEDTEKAKNHYTEYLRNAKGNEKKLVKHWLEKLAAEKGS